MGESAPNQAPVRTQVTQHVSLTTTSPPNALTVEARLKILSSAAWTRPQRRARAKKDPKERSPIEVLTTRREALSLYRAVWRASFLFVWKNEKGEEWRDIIRESARKEFEAARHEKDPEMITRLLVTGRDYLDQAMEKFMTKRQSIIDGDSENSSEPGR